MQYKALKHSNINLSEIGLGCASYWGKKHFSEKRAIDVVHQAIESGINYFDTGHSYSGGYAEVRLGKALLSYRNKELFVSSKAGTRLGHFGRIKKDFSPAWLIQSCEQTLKQLHIEQLPIFFLHGPNPEDFNDEVFTAIEKLKQEGKIGVCGVNSFDDHILNLTIKSEQFQCVMLDYNLFTQHRLSQIKDFKQQGLDVIVAGGLGGGFYQTRFNKITSIKQLWYWLRAFKNHRSKLNRAKSFEFLNHQEMASAIQIALAFVLQESAIKSTLIGTTSAQHLQELVEATDLKLSEQLLQQINELA